MTFTMTTLSVGKYDLIVAAPQGEGPFPVCYWNASEESENQMEEFLPVLSSLQNPFYLVAIQTKDWNRYYTPWPSPALRNGEDPFGGLADEYLKSITETIKPEIDARFSTLSSPEHTYLMGYSLGGLCALYALFQSKAFGKIGSMSGSLWYDEWPERIRQMPIPNKDCKVYLSLGNKEIKNRNPRMGRIGESTKETLEYLSEVLTAEPYFEWNEGGHFTEIPSRFFKLFRWFDER